MRTYTDKEYLAVIEENPDPTLQRYTQAETQEILCVKDPHNKTFIDLGAGYGRVLPLTTDIARNVICVELNPGMLPELKKRTKQHSNAETIIGDITTLSKTLQDKETHNPVLLLLHNTLGTIEGKHTDVLAEMKQFAKENHGEIILSLTRSEALPTWGLTKLYPSFTKIIGEPDQEKTDLQKGIYATKTGYTSKWRSKQEIKDIKEYFAGELINETWAEEYYILHIKYH